MSEDGLLAAISKLLPPLAYGLSAGSVRSIMGDKTAGWKGWVTNITISMFVVFMCMFALDGEPYSDGKKTFFTLVGGFLARDVLVALLSIGTQIRQDPWGLLARLREAYKGGGSPK